MTAGRPFTEFGALRIVATTFGVLAGLGGIRHGIGEIRQGSVSPDGFIIDSWTEGPFATKMDGEPALTIIPNLLATGILAIIVSTVVIVWAVGFVDRKHGGSVLALLAVGMFLVGGGFGPPMTGLLAGLVGMGIRAEHPVWSTVLRENIREPLARLWPWVFGLSVVNGVFLFIVSIFLVYYTSMNNPDLFLGSFYLVVIGVLLSALTGVAYDMKRQDRMQHMPA